MNNYVVRMVLPDGVHALDPTMRTFLQVLDKADAIEIQRDDADGMCFDVLPTDQNVGWNSAYWARETAAAFVAFGFNAVRAPAL